MNTLEDKVRAALRLTAEEIPPYTVPPLRLPNGWRPPARRLRAYPHGWGPWLAPLAAAAAVTAVIAGSLAISGAVHARPPKHQNRTSAAAALSASKIQRLRAAFSGVKLYSMYGLTECQRVSYLPPDQIDAHPTSVGIAIPGSEVFVVNEHGQRAAPGTVGELVISGPHVMKGYWNQPEATARVLRPGPASGETLLYSGDLFKVDETGFLYFVSRKDDIIKTRGEKVAPRQVEEVISRLPGVAEVAVYGIPDEVLGEAVAAVVTLTQGTSLTGERIQRYCLEHLEAFMVPKTVDLRDSLPTTITGKVSRRALQAETATRSGEACT